jgi:FtsZ-binding cell division protein ZapB
MSSHQIEQLKSENANIKNELIFLKGSIDAIKAEVKELKEFEQVMKDKFYDDGK